MRRDNNLCREYGTVLREGLDSCGGKILDGTSQTIAMCTKILNALSVGVMQELQELFQYGYETAWNPVMGTSKKR